MNELSRHLADLAHRGDALDCVAYTISSKSHKPIEADYLASFDEEGRFYAGSWPNIIREARRVLLACLVAYDQATVFRSRPEQQLAPASLFPGHRSGRRGLLS